MNNRNHNVIPTAVQKVSTLRRISSASCFVLDAELFAENKLHFDGKLCVILYCYHVHEK